jgi:hypothetical protein
MRRMKIVAILPADKPNTAHNYRINVGFINKLSTLCEYYPVYAYERDKVLISAREVYERYKPDAVLLLAHSDVLNGYLKGLQCLKVMIAVDYYKIVQRNKFYWYKNNEFDLVVQRQVYDDKQFSRDVGIPSVWVPYCASPKEFYPDEWKHNRIGFVGTVNERSYPIRFKAITTLSELGLLENRGRVVGDDYSKVLSSYRSMLTSTNMFISKSPHAKFFEIIASGSIALTNRFDHSDVLFKNKCWVEFKDDCSDVVDKARWIMNNENECRNMRDEAHREFLEKHTDDIRIKELHDVLKTQLEGRELYKKWSI